VHISLIKHLRGFLIGIIVLVILLVGTNYLHTWYRRAHAIKQTMQILSSEMARSAETIEYSEHENGVARFRIRAQKLMETRQGKNFLEGIEAEDFNPDGSIRNRISSRKAEYDKEGKVAEFIGDVRVQMGEEASLSAGNLRYDLRTNTGFIKDRLQFNSKQMRGTAGGGNYDDAQKTLSLTSNVDFNVVSNEAGATNSMGFEEIHITSKNAYFSRSAHVFSFQSDAYVDAGSATLAADKIDVILTDDEKYLKSLRCLGNAAYQAKGAAEQRTLKGEEMVFLVNQSSRALEKIDVRGQASFSSSAEGREQELRGAEIHLELDPEKGLPLLVQSTTGVRFSSKRGSDESVVTANRLEATFISGSGLLDRIHVWESAKMSNRSAGDVESESLMADEIQISFREMNARTGIQQLEAKGNVRWNSNAAANGDAAAARQTQSLSAGSLKMNYAAAADFVESGVASGNVTITGIPAAGGGNSQVKRLEADTVQFRFLSHANRLRNFEGDGHVRVTFNYSAAPGSENSAQDFSTSSAHMRADFQESDGAMQSVSQWGDFVYHESSRKASAGRSDYDALKQVLVLREKPKIEDSSSSTTAEVMELDRQSKTLYAHRLVRSVLQAKEGMPGAHAQKSASSASATVCTAEELQYWMETSRAKYSGNVQMLSESSQLQAQVLEIFGGGERIVAEGGIRHIMPQYVAAKSADLAKLTAANGARSPENSSAEGVISIASSQLQYARSKSSLIYSGKVVLKGADFDMSSESLEVAFDSAGKQIERATAVEKVIIHQSGREARGDTADYFLNPKKFVVSGNNAEIIDPQRGKSVARRLTFFASDDRILLENR
jgi:LPS export ABC transporter protein LptC